MTSKKNKSAATMGWDYSPSHRSDEIEEGFGFLSLRGGMENILKDMIKVCSHGQLLRWISSRQQQSKQLLAEMSKVLNAGVEKIRWLEDTTRDLEGRNEELEIVVRAQGAKISELFASLKKKDTELAEVCIASKERIWELEVDLKSKEHRIKKASDEAKELREELAKLQSEDSKDESEELAAECAEVVFSACVDLIKGRYPQLDLSFCDLGSALKAQQQGKS